MHALSKKLGRNGHTCSHRRCTESILWLRNVVASVASVHHHSFFSPFFSGFSLFLSLSPVSRTPPTYDHMTPFSRATLVPSALKRSIEAVYRILQKKTLPLATRRVEKELLPIKKARTRFFFFFERPRGVNAFYGPRIQWLPPTIPPCTCNNALSMENSRESLPLPLTFPLLFPVSKETRLFEPSHACHRILPFRF